MIHKIVNVAESLNSRFDLKRIGGDRTGIKEVFRRGVSNKHFSIKKRILDSNSDIFFMGLSLQKLDNVTEFLEEKARSGVDIRLLVPDPHEEWLIEAIAELLGKDGVYPRELGSFFSTLYPIWNNAREKIMVRVYSKIPSLSAMMFDGEEGNIEIYMYGWETEKRIMMELQYSKYSKDVKENLNLIWRDSKQLESAEDFTDRIDSTKAIARTIADRQK
jgi:hypothetical protein